MLEKNILKKETRKAKKKKLKKKRKIKGVEKVF